MGEVRRRALPSSGCDNRPGWEPIGVVVNKWGRVDVVWRRLPAPDTETRNPGGDAVGSERDDRPVMAWWVRRDYRALVSPQTGRVEKLNNADPHPLDVAKVMGWRAVEVCDG